MLSIFNKCGLGNVVIFLLLLVFTIGLNLGIHGALHFGNPHSPRDVTTSDVGLLSRAPSTDISPAQVRDDSSSIITELVRPEVRPDTMAARVIPPTPPPVETPIVERRANMGVIQSFVHDGGKFPILLITCNRPDILKVTLNSLLSVVGVSASNILVVQDGSMESVSEVVKSQGIKVIQNVRGVGLRGGAGSDGASRIATHYKFALTTAFQEYPDSPGVIVVEDDLLFSPDFFEYFHVVAPVLDRDKSIFALSAWNDNGFIGKVKDPYKLERTDYFPGLGWLISRELYVNELESKWPRAHWDHWLRSEDVNKNREIVHPEVPRTFHNGIKGTFMDLSMHNLYFRDIGYNTDPSISWKRHEVDIGHAVYQSVLSEQFEAEVSSQIKECLHVTSVDEIISAPGIEAYNSTTISDHYTKNAWLNSWRDALRLDRCGPRNGNE